MSTFSVETRRSRHEAAIVEALRAGLCRGEDLAKRLGISPRSLYRNIAQMKAAGVPIRGEAGVGYVLRRQPGVSS